MTDVRREMFEYARAQAKARAERKKDVKKLKKIKPKPKKGSRVGKLGIVRLAGKDLEALREERYEIDRGRCVDCGPESRVLPLEGSLFERAHMAHVRNKRMYGDAIANVRTKCYHHHIEVDHNAGGKPVPSKKNCGISG